MKLKFLKPKQYQLHCKKLFKQYKGMLIMVLPLAQIEHIGSSAVPDCLSKGDLDIYVGVEEQEFNKTLQIVQEHGFKIKSDTLRTGNLCMLENKEVAIQLVVKGSEFESFLTFRNALIEDPLLVQQYNQLKIDCTDLSMEQYRLVKSKFIQKVLSKA